MLVLIKTHAGYNWTWQNPTMTEASNPFDLWLLCKINGSYTDLAPMAMLLWGAMGNASLSWNASGQFESQKDWVEKGHNISFGMTPVTSMCLATFCFSCL